MLHSISGEQGAWGDIATLLYSWTQDKKQDTKWTDYCTHLQKICMVCTEFSFNL